MTQNWFCTRCRKIRRPLSNSPSRVSPARPRLKKKIFLRVAKYIQFCDDFKWFWVKFSFNFIQNYVVKFRNLNYFCQGWDRRRRNSIVTDTCERIGEALARLPRNSFDSVRYQIFKNICSKPSKSHQFQPFFPNLIKFLIFHKNSVQTNNDLRERLAKVEHESSIRWEAMTNVEEKNINKNFAPRDAFF